MSTSYRQVSPRVAAGGMTPPPACVTRLVRSGLGRSARRMLTLVAAAGLVAGCDAGEEATVGSQVLAVGAPPVNSLPTPQTVNEDSTLLFVTTNGNGILVSDDDNTILTVQISVTNGTFTLSGTGGLTVTGNGTLNMIATGPTEDLNTALQSSRYRPSANFSGGATLQINTSDSNGESDLDVMSINVTPFNDPPVNVVPTAVQSATEDIPKAFTLSVTDPDIGGFDLVVSLTGSNSTAITLPTTTGLTFTSGTGSDDATMTFSGTLTSVNTALNGLVVTPAANFIGASTLTVICNDQGASGGGDPGIDNDPISINWSAVNDPPVNTVPASPQATVEDTPRTFSTAGGNALSTADVDATTALVQITLTAASGTVTLGVPGLVTFTAGDGVVDTTMTFNGTLANLNAALDGTSLNPSANFAGSASLTMIANDLGNFGSGGARQDTDTVTVNVAAVNDGPVNTLPAGQTTNEDVARTFSTGNGNAITVADPDAPSLQVTLTAASATLTLGSTGNLTFQAGDGTADVTTTFTGTVAAVNVALNGTKVTPNSNFSGTASLTVLTSDLGGTGTGGPLTDQDAVVINVVSFNDPPDAVNDLLVVAEDAPATALAVRSNDTFAPDVGETLTVTSVGIPVHGTATTDGATVSYQPVANYNGPDSFVYTVSDGNGGLDSAAVSVTVTAVNDAPTAAADSFRLNQDSSGNSLAVLSNDSSAPDGGETLTISAVDVPLHGSASLASGSTRVNYTPTAGYSGPDSFTYTISDGNGGTASATVALDIVEVNTRPVNALPGPQVVVEDTPLNFSSLAGNAITVSDSDGGTLTVLIQVTNGTFTLATTAGLTVTGNGSASVNASGTIAALNTGLNSGRYNPSVNYSGDAALTIHTSDSNGQSDQDVLTLAVSPFNDPPTNAGVAAAGAVEDVPEVFNLSVSDPDLSGGNLVVSLTANNATTISLATTSGLVFSAGDGSADTAMTFSGALSSVNPALNGLSVTAPANYIGPSTLVVTSNDQGSTGAGSIGQDTDTINITWGTDNDPPVNAVAAGQTMVEDQILAFSASSSTGLSVSDPDVGGGNLQVTLAATNGRLTLGDPGAVTMTVSDGVSETTMTFRGTAAAVGGALEGTSYAPNLNFAGLATITMTTSDLGNSGGAAKTDTDSISVTVSPVNDAPVISLPSPSTTNEDVARVFATGQGNPVTVSDPDATALQVSLAGSAGVLSLGVRTGLVFQAGDGITDSSMTFTGTIAAVNAAMNSMSFIPAANFVGPGSFTLLVSDLGAAGAGGSLSDEESLNISIVSVNDPPVAVADTVTTFEDVGLLQIDVMANDTTAPDVGETLTPTTVSTPLHGTAVIAGGSITYSPAGDYHGADSFIYGVSDGNGGTASATVSLTVTAVNDPPNAVNDAFTVAGESAGASLAVRANDTFLPDGTETLTVASVTQPANGTTTITGTGGTTAVLYVPDPGYVGPDPFTYTLSDGVGGTDSATVSITVTPPVPVANDDAVSVAEDVPGFLDVLSNDTGLSDTPLVVAITVAPTHGTAVVQGNQTVLYSPAANYHGADAFTYRVTDSTADTDTAEVAVTVTPVDDHPAAVDDARTIEEDSTAAIAVTANDTGTGDQPLTVTIETAPQHGSATAEAGASVSYEPTADFAGTDTFRYTVRDADGDVSSATVTMTVTPVNDTPLAVGDVVSTRAGEARIVAVLDNDVDADSDELAVLLLTIPPHGAAAIRSDGTVGYTPAAGYTGTDSFVYTIGDGSGEQATATVTIGVGLDSDDDGLLDADEIEVYSTDPQVADTDGDELADGVEVLTSGTDALDDDSDDDGLLDGNEDVDGDGVVGAGETSANAADSDGDGLQDGTELGLAAPQGEDTATAGFTADADPETTTDPTVADTDGGSLADGEEDLNHNGRVDDGETDPNERADDVPRGGGSGEFGDHGGGGCQTAAGGGPRESGATLAWVIAALALSFAGRRRHGFARSSGPVVARVARR
jgi:large repetitive protein